jgi:transcriptional regulator with XRE-family HTH domain
MNKILLLKRFGKNVKIERIKKDLTQEQLAELMNVSQHYVACIETGRENMSLGKVLELAGFLKTDIHNLLNFK